MIATNREENRRAFGISFQYIGMDTDDFSPVPIPDPYPINPPEMVELPEFWYVVDCGTEVGIFSDE